MKAYFAWYDLWVGVYVDRKKRKVYVCPIPCFVIEIDLPVKESEK